jgi:hypothetical protein
MSKKMITKDHLLLLKSIRSNGVVARGQQELSGVSTISGSEIDTEDVVERPVRREMLLRGRRSNPFEMRVDVGFAGPIQDVVRLKLARMWNIH